VEADELFISRNHCKVLKKGTGTSVQ